MDQPALDPGEHRRALRGLRRINQVSRASAVVWRVLARIATTSTSAPLRVLDLACGGGDVLIDCALLARKSALPIDFHGCDRSETAVAFARDAARRDAAGDVTFSRLDVTHDELPTGYDVVMCTLFLHHLAEDEAVRLLRRMAEVAHRAVIVDDLRRSRPAWALAWIGCHLLTRSRVVHGDGPLSVKAAYTLGEMRSLCASAELANARFAKHWPARFLMEWTKP